MKQMLKAGYITEEEFAELEEKEIDMTKFRMMDHNTGIAPYLREYLRRVVADWSKNFKKPDGSHYDIYKDGLKIYTTVDSRMQGYAEEAVEEHMKKYLQPEFYKHWKGRKNAPYYRLSEEEIESLMKQAIRRSDRYISMRADGKSDQEIATSFTTPTEMTIFSWDREIDTVMTPIDSIRYYKFFLRTGVVSMDPQTGHVKAYVGGINYKRLSRLYMPLLFRRAKPHAQNIQTHPLPSICPAEIPGRPRIQGITKTVKW
jgi:penicillin-binding protein 1A